MYEELKDLASETRGEHARETEGGSESKIPKRSLQILHVLEEGDPGRSLFTRPTSLLQSICPLVALPYLAVSKLSDSCLS